MRKIGTYYQVLILVLTMIVAPVCVKAQSAPSLARERDSLVNVISKESNPKRLATLNLALANRYLSLGQYEKLNEAAQKAVYYAESNNDYSTMLDAYLLLGHNNIILEHPVEAIQTYLSARKVIEKRAVQIRESDESGKKTKEQQKIDKQILQSDKELDADIVQEIGLVYFNRGHYNRAADNFRNSLKAFEDLKIEEKSLQSRQYLAACHSVSSETDEAIEQYKYLLKRYKDRDDWESTKMIYQRLNDLYIKKKDFENVYKYNRELYSECTKHNNIKESLNALNNLGYTYVNLGEYDKAIKCYKQLESVDPQYNDDRIMAGTYTNLGICYQNMGNHDDEAIDYLKKSIALRKKHSQDQESAVVGNIISLIYFKKQDYHNAEYMCKDAVKDAENSGDTATIMTLYDTYSKILNAMGHSDKAFEYYRKYSDMKESRELNNTLGQRHMADDLKMLTDAEKNYQEGLMKKDIDDFSQRQLQLLAESRERENEMLKKENELQEMKAREAQNALRLMQQQQAALKQEAEIAKLREQDAKNQAELDREKLQQIEQQQKILAQQREQEQLENKIANQEAEAGRMRAVIALILAVVLFFIVMFFMLRNKNKRLKEQQAEIEQKNQNLIAANNEILTKNEELSHQKAIIEEANKSITDSIVYAKRIQSAVCPSPDFLSSFDFDYFLFFRPRDIVSGDYYWFYADENNHIFIVAADCTGHGVPGAFMSMLGLSLFNKIVAERQIIEPGDILTNLRTEVKAALHQDSINSSQKDGMDLSLVRYDVDTNMLHFAGANNNGYLIKRYSFEEEEEARKDLQKPDHIRDTPYGFLRLVAMPADSMPIGVYIREKERFSQYSYQLRKGDSFYLTSDGYIDQFGGEHGRKFLSKNFQKMLMDINGYDMKHQERMVVDTHEEWIGESYEQLDDIIVIGIRV